MHAVDIDCTAFSPQSLGGERTQTTHLLGPLRQVLVDAIVASVHLAAREPSHIPGLKAALGHPIEVSEPLQGGPRRVSPKLVGLVEALLVHRLFCAIGGKLCPEGHDTRREDFEESRCGRNSHPHSSGSKLCLLLCMYDMQPCVRLIEGDMLLRDVLSSCATRDNDQTL